MNVMILYLCDLHLILNLKLPEDRGSVLCQSWILSCSWYHVYLDKSWCSINVRQQTECGVLKETASWILQLRFMLASMRVSRDLQNLPLLMTEVTSQQITGWKGEASWELKFIYGQQTTEIHRVDYRRHCYIKHLAISRNEKKLSRYRRTLSDTGQCHPGQQGSLSHEAERQADEMQTHILNALHFMHYHSFPTLTSSSAQVFYIPCSALIVRSYAAHLKVAQQSHSQLVSGIIQRNYKKFAKLLRLLRKRKDVKVIMDQVTDFQHKYLHTVHVCSSHICIPFN